MFLHTRGLRNRHFHERSLAHWALNALGRPLGNGAQDIYPKDPGGLFFSTQGEIVGCLMMDSNTISAISFYGIYSITKRTDNRGSLQCNGKIKTKVTFDSTVW